ncbi:mucin-13 isoform X1 [Canis lupus familiaris]|uniref:mucin-13 isoform X1 n=1 Tax=Canis lupus familiaris TaxID=9615 RepID=UPI0002747929|nr:mucin-13 isoform X1 [Canis lupus familiaris]XP_038318419.1 mucin-13 isoform X1 [Canis lupus familiaris]
MTSVSSTVSTTTVTTISAGSGNSDTATTSTISVTNNGSSVNTTTQNNSSAATSSVISSKTSTPTIPSPPGPSSPCQGAPCKGDSSCVSLNSTYFCLCFFGYYYNSSTCKKGKVFPGTIKVEVSEVSGLGDENSLAYQQLHNKVIEFFGGTFRNFDYGQTVIDGVSIRPSARLEMRAGGTGVEVTVLNIFAETTKENEGTVLELVTKAIENNKNNILGYSNQSLCDYFNCEKENAQDKCDNGLLCKCKPGFERPNPQIPMCLASAPTCPDTCNANNNRQCLVNKDNTGVECVCLSGYKEDDHGICQKCGFGYGGVNCEDQFQLILTIVGSIGGALILGLVIALICLTRSKNKDKYIEEQNLIENDFQNLRLQQTTGFSNLGADGSIFPKVRANISGQPQNPYANHRSMPRPDY